MRLVFLGTDPASGGGQCPNLYATDRDTFLVQGWKVDQPANLQADETIVEIPADLLQFVPADLPVGDGPHPSLRSTGRGTFLVQGARVTDAAALVTLHERGLPDTEDVVEVAALVLGYIPENV